MQRFELVGGGSAKFWEVDRDGTTVTVRFGRIGTAGQSQVKTFGSAADAEAHRAKLIAGKTKKGYLPIASVSLTPAPPPARTSADPADEAVRAEAGPAEADPAGAVPAVPGTAGVPSEDVLVLPASWRAAAWPRRDRDAPSVVAAPPGRELELLRRTAGSLRTRLTSATTEPDVSDAGLAYLDARLSGTAGQDDPFGAAVVVTAVIMSIPYDDHDTRAPVADDWVERLGYGFAAAATAELSGLMLAGTSSIGHDNVGVVRIGTAGARGRYLPHWFPLAVRLRALLAVAGDADRAAAVQALAGYRQGWLDRHRALTSFLLPDRLDWVAADCADLATSTDIFVGRALGGSAHRPEQVVAMAGAGWLSDAGDDLPLLATMMIGVGAGIGPVLYGLIDWSYQTADTIKRLLAALALVPTDEAFRLLMANLGRKYTHVALMDAIERFPYRALRLLASPPGGDRTAAGLLRVHVVTRPDVARQVLPTLPPAAAERVRAILDAAATVTVAPARALPPVLADPPWTGRRPAVKPVVVAGLAAAPEAAMAWKPGEREAFLARRAEIIDLARTGRGRTWEELAALEVDGRGREAWREMPVMVHAPDEVTRPRLAGWVPRTTWHLGAATPALAARYEVDVLPTLLALARLVKWEVLPALMPYASGEVALLVADWYGRRSVRAQATAWLLRHPGVAARALVPAAVGKAGVARRQAEQALRVVAGAGHRDEIEAAARGYGPPVLAAVTALLDTDPLEVLPAKVPVVPGWLDPAVLPPVPLASRAGALPADAVRHLCTVFALSTVAEPYAGVAQVVAACEPGPLAEFWWEAFTRWQQLGYPPAQGWVLQALGLVGDDETVRRLSPLIRAWPGEGGHTRAVAALDVLAGIGSDMALMHLHGIATKVKFAGLRDRAREKVDEVADGLGLTADQLADRLVPDFGLDDDGSLVLDFGPRSFTVGFDEQLKPYVVDQAGTHRTALPKPGAKDDPVLAPAAAARFAALKKDVRTASADQIRRLEQAMKTGRGWTGAEFRTLFVAHPLLVHLVRRLVWSTAGAASFRVAEDRTLADSDDDPFTVADDAVVRVAHPLDLGPATKVWAEVFADYEILQPFAQLERETFTLAGDEVVANRLTRWADRKVATTSLLALERRGWQRGAPQDGGVQGWFELPVGDLTVVVSVDPGIVMGEPTMFAEQKMGEVWLKRSHDSWWVTRNEGAPLGSLDRVVMSEVLRDLTHVLG